MMRGMIIALTCLMLWALTKHCYRCCSCRTKKDSKVIFCRDVSTMSQTTYLARHCYDPVRGYEGDVEVFLRGAITGITVDAAADEILGAEMMRTPALTSEMQALAPNLRHVIRDKAHAPRRLSQRPFAA